MTSATDQQDTVMSRNNAVNAANNGSILETFNNEDAPFPFIPANMMAPVNSMHLNLPYTIRSTSGDILNQEYQTSDMFDMNELFQGNIGLSRLCVSLSFDYLSCFLLQVNFSQGT